MFFYLLRHRGSTEPFRHCTSLNFFFVFSFFPFQIKMSSVQTPSKGSTSNRQILKEITTRSSMAADMLIANLPSTTPTHRGIQQQGSASSASFAPVSPKNENASTHHHSSHHHHHSKSSGNIHQQKEAISKLENSTAEKMKSIFKKNIVGDLFGTSHQDDSLVGFMYRSRIIEKSDSKVNTQEKKEENLQVDSVVSSNEIIETDSDSDNDAKMLKNMNPKQQLAMTIKNWSVFPENDEYLIKEGAVYALIALAHMDDSTIRKCCASSFFHLSSREKNREELLTIGTTAGIITLAMQARNW
jgi:hypothetical protein